MEVANSNNRGAARQRAVALAWPIVVGTLVWVGQAAIFACRVVYSEPALMDGNATRSGASWQSRVGELAVGLGPYSFGGTIWDVFAVATARAAATLVMCTFLALASVQAPSGALRRTLRRCVRLPPLHDGEVEAGDAHLQRAARTQLTLCCSLEWTASVLATSCVAFALAKCLARLVVGGGYPSTTCSSLYFWLEIGADLVASLLLADGVPRALGAARVVAEDDLIAADDAAYALTRSGSGSGSGSGALRVALLAPSSDSAVDVELSDHASKASRKHSTEREARARKRTRKRAAGSALGAGEKSDDGIEKDGGIAPIKSSRSLYLLVRFALRDWPLLLVAFAALVVAAVGQAVIPHLTGASLSCSAPARQPASARAATPAPPPALTPRIPPTHQALLSIVSLKLTSTLRRSRETRCTSLSSRSSAPYSPRCAARSLPSPWRVSMCGCGGSSTLSSFPTSSVSLTSSRCDRAPTPHKR
jgi:hypothetical protein